MGDLNEWGPKLLAALQASPVIADVNSDQQQKGLETDVTYDRATAARLGLTVSELDSTLYDAFGQRQVSTIYNALNQYHVIMEVAPRYWQSPQSLDDIYVSTSGGAATGTQTSNLATVGGGATSTTAIGGSGSGRRRREQLRTKRVDECDREHRPRGRVERRGRERQAGDDGAPARR